jgi:hypothetical protein
MLLTMLEIFVVVWRAERKCIMAEIVQDVTPLLSGVPA